jgi:Domain of unknown function (DUF4139)/N-terminal domain of unknown function (DUF4140)
MRILTLSILSMSVAAQTPPSPPNGRVQTTPILQTTLKQARVYPHQAWVTRECAIHLDKAGSHRFSIMGLPANLGLDDIRVQAEGIPGLRLGNVSIQSSASMPAAGAKLIELRNQEKLLQKELDSLVCQENALSAAQSALDGFKPTPNAPPVLNLPSGSPVNESKLSLELCRQIQERQSAYLRQGLSIKTLRGKVSERIDVLQCEIFQCEEATKSQRSTLQVELEVPAPGDLRIQIENQTQAARWRPTYEVHLDTASQRLELLCYASVSQASNEDWHDIHLQISNAEPGRRFTLPASPNPIQLLYEAPVAIATGRIEGRITDRNGRPLSAATVEATCDALKQRRTVQTDANGVYRISLLPPGEYLLRATKAGHPSTSGIARVLSGQAAPLSFQMVTTAGATVEVVSEMASAAKTDDKIATNFSAEKTFQLPQALENTPSHYESSGEFGQTWTFSGGRTLPSDARSRRVLLARAVQSSGLKLIAIPRRASEIFQVAVPSLPASFPLFPGTTTVIFRDEERLGQIDLPRVKANEGIQFSLGPAKGLSVQRQRIEATMSTHKDGRIRQWILRDRVTLFNTTDQEVEVEVQEPGLNSISNRISVEPLPTATPASPSDHPDGNRTVIWNVKIPAHGQTSIEEGWRIQGPATGSIPQLAALGLPLSD